MGTLEINTIPIEFTLDDIYEELEEIKSDYINHDILYYPYTIFETSVEAKVLTRKFSENLCCWIDLATGREALSGPVKSREIIDAKEDKIIKREISGVGLKEKAKSYINFALFSKMKILKVPEINVVDTFDIYRPFYILKFQKQNKKNTIMVDGISGEHYLLRM